MTSAQRFPLTYVLSSPGLRTIVTHIHLCGLRAVAAVPTCPSAPTPPFLYICTHSAALAPPLPPTWPSLEVLLPATSAETPRPWKSERFSDGSFSSLMAKLTEEQGEMSRNAPKNSAQSLVCLCVCAGWMPSEPSLHQGVEGGALKTRILTHGK